jgi:hypothetical protein
VSLARTLRTLRHVRPRQLAAQLWHAAGPRARPREVDPGSVHWAVDSLAVPPLPPPAHARWDGAGRIELVGREVDFGSLEAIDFSHTACGPLWAYQLHFFEWVRSPDATPAGRARAVEGWLGSPRTAPGWDAHPISVRALSWLKLRLAGELPEGFAGSPADARLRASLASQIDWLSRNVETRLQANHLLENWIAIVAGGLALQAAGTERWLEGAGSLAAELRDQLGADGAHCERSPMYQAVLLEHLLDLYSLARAAGTRSPAGLAGVLADACGRMRTALETWTHPDGEIALLGDAAFGYAQAPAVLARYADALGIGAAVSREPGLLRSTGHARLETASLCWIGSLGGPSPAHQPGHAHCDALAFELSVQGQRVVTDTGVYEYVEGERRTVSRATRSHATLEVEGRDQAEVWSAHRVGGRPQVALVGWEPGRAVEGACAGWATPRCRHRRRAEVDGDDLVLRDRIEGGPAAVRASLPLAPGLEPRLDGAVARIGLPAGGSLRVELPETLTWRIQRAPYYPRFGEEQQRAVLVGEASGFESGSWRFALER